MREDMPCDGEGPRVGRRVDGLDLALDDVVVIFACNELYVPYLSVALQSLVEHASDGRRYDVVVLSNGVVEASRETLRAQVRSHPGCDIDFLEVSEALSSLKLPTHGHFKSETYVRLFAPELLKPLGKALYLDCDLIVVSDVAELFDADVEGHLLAAAQDPDTIGQANGYNSQTERYVTETLGLASSLDYFQAGVILFNLAEFRASHTTGEMVELACSQHWQWLDQDVLNVLARNRHLKVDMAWNTLFDWEGIRRSRIIGSAPEQVRGRYEAARANPRIVHYAGPDCRPWLYPDADMADLWWEYAGRSPYREEIARRLRRSHTTPKGLLKRFQVFCLYRLGMDLFDLLFPPKTRRRSAMIRAFKIVGGHLV